LHISLDAANSTLLSNPAVTASINGWRYAAAFNAPWRKDEHLLTASSRPILSSVVLGQ